MIQFTSITIKKFNNPEELADFYKILKPSMPVECFNNLVRKGHAVFKILDDIDETSEMTEWRITEHFEDHKHESIS